MSSQGSHGLSPDADLTQSDSAILNELGLDATAAGVPPFADATFELREQPNLEQLRDLLQVSLSAEFFLVEDLDILTFHQLVEAIHRNPLTSEQQAVVNHFRQAAMVPILNEAAGEARLIVAVNTDRVEGQVSLASDAFPVVMADVLQQAGIASDKVVCVLVDGLTYHRLFEGETSRDTTSSTSGEPTLPPLLVDAEFRKRFLHELDTDQDARLTSLTLIQYAIGKRASDIHIEPHGEDKYRVRLRVDGHLQSLEQPFSHQYGVQVVRAIAGRAGLEIDKWFLGHDGGIRFSSEETARHPDLDGWTLRVSIVPASRGPKAVLRLLQTNVDPSRFTLESLGYSQDELQAIHEQLGSSTGIVLMTGPTGSGKTTSLYSMLNYLNRVERSIVTIEDPVEYELLGLNQCSANPKGFSFDAALRHFMRQDPDIILVGEIRDGETASAAVRAAATGHLVLSTVHTNDSVSTLERLFDLGLDRSQVATSLRMVIAQRLVRQCCPACVQVEDGTARLNALLQEDLFDVPVYVPRVTRQSPRRCRTCHGQGYVGRTAVPEVWALSDEERALLCRYGIDVQQRDFLDSALKNGMTPLWQRGLELVVRRKTTLDEYVSRVVTSIGTLREFRYEIHIHLMRTLERHGLG